MSAKELRPKSAADLQKELLELRREQFNLRMARATGQAAKPDQFTQGAPQHRAPEDCAGRAARSQRKVSEA